MTELIETGNSEQVAANNDDEDESDDAVINNQIKELNFDFRDEVSDKPEIIKYIERLHTIIRRQQKKLNKFYNKLKDHRFVKYNGKANKAVQTNNDGHGDESDDDDERRSGKDDKKDSSEADIASSPCKSKGAWNLAQDGSNIVDEVKEAAENAMKQTSFVYEPTSGMYYDYSTGYYYNAELRMYYDGNSGRYMMYNEETKQYHYENGEQVPCLNATSQKRTKKLKEKHRAKKPKECKLDEAEEGEITESSVSSSESDECSSDVGDGRANEDDCSTHLAQSEDAGFGCEPCIRIIVEETNVERLKTGSLFMVTCKGGTMGREGDHAVLIPDINVSKHHARFLYNPVNSGYYIIDLGSRNGTWLDGERLSAALQESEAFELRHGAIIQVGGTKLSCHVHGGRDTCPSCEPGLVQPQQQQVQWGGDAQAREFPAPTRHPEYKRQLQNLKKKFGVDAQSSQDVYKLPGYEDRAEMRRNTVGSSHHSEKTHSSSLTEVMPQSNKGFKMLTKMGWNEGEKLGKDNRGLLEPIPLISNEGKTGLGASSVVEPKVPASVKKKQVILQKTQDRYRNISREEGAT